MTVVDRNMQEQIKVIFNVNIRTLSSLTLILLTWRIRRANNNASRWQMEFNSVYKGLIKSAFDGV